MKSMNLPRIATEVFKTVILIAIESVVVSKELNKHTANQRL